MDWNWLRSLKTLMCPEQSLNNRVKRRLLTRASNMVWNSAWKVTIRAHLVKNKSFLMGILSQEGKFGLFVANQVSFLRGSLSGFLLILGSCAAIFTQKCRSLRLYELLFYKHCKVGTFFKLGMERANYQCVGATHLAQWPSLLTCVADWPPPH